LQKYPVLALAVKPEVLAVVSQVSLAKPVARSEAPIIPLGISSDVKGALVGFLPINAISYLL
jgi:hypothetical protein